MGQQKRAVFISSHELNGQRIVVDLGQKFFYRNEGDADVNSSDEGDDDVIAGSSFAQCVAKNNKKWNTVGKAVNKKAKSVY